MDDHAPVPRPDEHDALLKARPQLIDLLAVFAGRGCPRGPCKLGLHAEHRFDAVHDGVAISRSHLVAHLVPRCLRPLSQPQPLAWRRLVAEECAVARLAVAPLRPGGGAQVDREAGDEGAFDHSVDERRHD